MRRPTPRFARPSGHVSLVLEGWGELVLPLFAGILRHPRESELAALLGDSDVARKYTRQALRIAAWPVLREFPRAWLRACLPGTELPAGRRRALEFLLGVSTYVRR